MCKGVNPDKLIMLETEVPLNVTITEIFQFMVKDPCPYTEKEKDSNKGMEAIFYFKNGWVKRVIGKKIDDVYVVRGEVKHSFSLNQPPLLPWVVIKDDGTVLAAHCTCAIGLLECCSHVGATLFSLDDLRANVLEKKVSNELLTLMLLIISTLARSLLKIVKISKVLQKLCYQTLLNPSLSGWCLPHIYRGCGGQKV